MKDKEKQIEKTMYELYAVLREHLYRKESAIAAKSIAEHLIKNGWVKLTEDGVVLSREEYQEYQKFKSFMERNDWENVEHIETTLDKCQKVLYEKLQQESQKIAEKIILSEIATIKCIRDACVLPTQKYKEGYIDCCNGILFYLKNNIAKQFSIEIKE